MKIAALCSTYFPLSHADVILSRWLETLPNDANWGWQPASEIASLYVEHFPPDDQSRDKSAQFEVPLYDSIEAALCLGGDELAVDAVLLICEHGAYPLNEIGQKMYPRAQWFARVADVMARSGRVVPVWVDKGLSWNPAAAYQLVARARAQNIPLMSGSSLPLCGYVEPFPFEGREVSDAVALFHGGPEIYGYHSLELAHSILSARAGARNGVASVTALLGEAVWAALDDGTIALDLFDAALSQATSVEPGDVRQNCRPREDLEAALIAARTRGGMTATTQELSTISPMAFLVEHADGLRVPHVLLAGHLGNYCLAARSPGANADGANADGANADGANANGANANGANANGANANGANADGEVWASIMKTKGISEFHPHFAVQNAAIERFFRGEGNDSTFERGLLCTLVTEAWMRALQTPGVALATPELMEV